MHVVISPYRSVKAVDLSVEHLLCLNRCFFPYRGPALTYYLCIFVSIPQNSTIDRGLKRVLSIGVHLRRCLSSSHCSWREVRILLDNGANIDVVTADRQTPLHIAVEENHLPVVLTELCIWDLDISIYP